MRDFIIVTPRYVSNSNGIKTLHKICHTINKLGGVARLAFIESTDRNCASVALCKNGGLQYSPPPSDPDTLSIPLTHPDFTTPCLEVSERHLIDSSYVLYPEVMVGNPLNASRVIRYFGNREGYCNGKMIGIGVHDFLVAHSVAT